MKQKLFAAVALVSLVLSVSAQPQSALRIFLRCGPKTHGPGEHDGPGFLRDWKPLLTQRGAEVDGAIGFPTGEQLARTDVLVMYAAEAGTIKPEDRANLEQFLKRGGGMVVLHDSVCGKDPQWFKTVVGGAWEHGYSKWWEGEMSFYYADTGHPITRGCSNFELDDEMYYDLHMMPEARILGVAYTPAKPNAQRGRGPTGTPTVYDIQPQMWTYEKALPGGQDYRAVVSILGHKYANFSLPHVRAVLMRSIAWAGRRPNIEEFCTKQELASLRYPEGGPTAPKMAAAKLEVHPDFKISLVASEPLINKAINIDWDAAGRLWVAETPEYPNGRREPRANMKDAPWKDSGFRVRPPTTNRPAIDRISILSDTDGDGLMDRKEIFYEGLELVTGFVFHKDGVIAVQAPDILWIRDTDGDGKADKVERLYTGLGTGDTHAVINNPRWGYDGWIYCTHGYSGTDHLYNGDKSKDFGRVTSGVVRFKPDGSAFEQFSSKGGNTWGLDIGWDNEVFYTQPTSGDLLMHVVMPESVLARGKVGNTASYKSLIHRRPTFPLITHQQQAYVQIDVVGSFTAAAGCAIYDGGTWPSEWRYSYFTTEPTINIVHHEVVTPDGVSYKAEKTREPEFIGGRDKWFRPIETRIGPDGALYIIDFYNQAVIHNDTRGPVHGPANAAVRPDRDHYFGRIWRLDHKQAKNIPVPDLSKASPEELIRALELPNRHVRMNAQRLLVERGDPLLSNGSPTGLLVDTLAHNEQAPDYARVHALWIVGRFGFSEKTLDRALLDPSPAIRKTAIPALSQIFQTLRAKGMTDSDVNMRSDYLRHLNDGDAKVRLQAIIALGDLSLTQRTIPTLVEIYPGLKDPWLESAVAGVASRAPLEFISASLASVNQDALKGLVATLSSQIALGQDPELSSRLVALLASKPAEADALKQAVLESLAKGLKSESAPEWTPALQSAFQKLLASPNPALPAAALPLIARWDKSGSLAADTKSLVTALVSNLNDATRSDESRAQAARSLLGVRQMSGEILPSVGRILGSTASASLQRRVLEALGATADASVGAIFAEAFPKLSPALQEAAFAQMIKRSDWSLALLDAVRAGKVSLDVINPSNVHRLRNHSDTDVARRANAVVDELRGPAVKEKNGLLASLTPEVEKPGDAIKGKLLFTQNCAVCHKLEGVGREVGPDLTGMGAHGPAELLVPILDPNREVDPSFMATSIETKDGELYDGIVIRENKTSVLLRNNSTETEIKTEEIKTRSNTGRSLMPEGLEVLGAEGLRDILAYICGSEAKYRLIDLRAAFTADGTKGLYASREQVNDSLPFKKYGVIKAGDVPFEIISPAKTKTGHNVTVLKGGHGFAKTHPQRVEINGVNLKASRLHFLGGVAGWGFPCCGDDSRANLPAAKVTVQFIGGQRDEFILTNGVEIADYGTTYDVPGSQSVADLLERGQVRTFSRALTGRSAIQKIILESFDNAIAPTFVALTAELGEGGGAQYAQAAATTATDASTAAVRDFKWEAGTKVLILGGGSSHDFNKWYNIADTAILNSTGKVSVNYTDKPSAATGALKEIDVLYQSSNQTMKDPAWRKAVFEFADAGKGLLLVHPGLWYNWPDWPEYNEILCGGGARSHDKYGEFEVKLTEVKHPVTAGLPASFKISDELYHFEPDAHGSAIQVLATAFEVKSGKTYPMIWIVQHPKARIVAIALGHDGKAHELPEFKTLLKNSVEWAARKQ